MVVVGVQEQIRKEVEPSGQAGPLRWSALMGGVTYLVEFHVKIKLAELWKPMTKVCLLGFNLGFVFNKELV